MGPTSVPPSANLDPARLFDENVEHVYRVLRRFGVPERDVEDVAQEVFLVAFRRLDEYDPRYLFRTWLFGICRRCAAGYRRRAHRRYEVPLPTLPEPEWNHSPEAESDRRRVLKRFDEVLSRLSDDQRETYVLFELEALPMAEVARAMECPLQTAYARLYAARRIVREGLSVSARSVA